MREWNCLEQHNESETIQDLVLYRIETAKSDLKSAEVLLNAGEYRGANNRAYYSIYHAISAIHALNGKAYKRHKDSLGNFNKEYIKTGIFPGTLGRRIAEAEEIRHASDYDDFYIASRGETERQIAVADEFIQLVEKYCRTQIEASDRKNL